MAQRNVDPLRSTPRGLTKPKGTALFGWVSLVVGVTMFWFFVKENIPQNCMCFGVFVTKSMHVHQLVFGESHQQHKASLKGFNVVIFGASTSFTPWVHWHDWLENHLIFLIGYIYIFIQMVGSFQPVMLVFGVRVKQLEPGAAMMVNLRSVSSPLQQKQGEDSGGCFRKWWVFPQISHFDRVVHYFHPPFWGSVPLFLETPILMPFSEACHAFVLSDRGVLTWGGGMLDPCDADWFVVGWLGTLSWFQLTPRRGWVMVVGEAPNSPCFWGKKKIWEGEFDYLNLFFGGGVGFWPLKRGIQR